jgi:hypothetical protein
MFGILPYVFVIFGLIVAVYSQQAGLLFCKAGKAIWKISTFGLTDMHWFYPEDKAPRVMRQTGICFCLIGMVFVALSIYSLSGPNSFAAMSQAQDYLEKTYGDSQDGYSFSCHAIPNETNGVIVHYEYSGKTGNLHASWDGKKYIFAQEP